MKCPGQDTRYWKEDAIFEVKCPHCGTAVEFFKDDTSRPCPGCGKRLPNPRLDFGCAAYCPYAEQCLGALPPELQEKQRAVFKDRIEAEVLSRLGDEAARTLRMRLKFAEQIALEEGAKLPIVLAAACLVEFEEDPAEFLKDLNIPQGMRQEILEALRDDALLEAKVVRDATLLAREEKENTLYQTATGRRLAEALLS